MEKCYPLCPDLRIYTFGDLRLERRLPSSISADHAPIYEPIEKVSWSNRGPALTMLKILMCCDGRRASKDVLIDAIWNEDAQQAMKSVESALHTAASVLRSILRIPNGESLLVTTSGSDGIGYKLSDQQQLWVDADAFLMQINEAFKAKQQGNDPLPFWEAAYQLAQEAFLPNDLYATWSQQRHEIIKGHRRLCVYSLADIYVERGRKEEAEDVLRHLWAANPANEDALCRLMLLLEGQERYQEALLLSERTQQTLDEDGSKLSSHLQELISRIRMSTISLTIQEVQSVSQSRTQNRAISGYHVHSSPYEIHKQTSTDIVDENGSSLFPNISPILLESAIQQPTMQAYEDVLALAWEAFYTSSAQRAANTVTHWVLHLTQQINTLSSMSNQLMLLRCRFLQLDSVIARDRTDFTKAFNAVNEALTLAFHLKNTELVASSLYRRAKIWITQQKYSLAAQDLEQALPYAHRSRDPLRCYILMLLAETYSFIAPEEKSFFQKSFKLLDEVDRTVRSHGTLEGDGSYVKVDVPGLYMIRGDVLQRSGQIEEARKTLMIVRESLPKEFTRWQGNLLFSEAQLALAQGDIANSCQYGASFLEIARATNSRSGEAKLHRLYRELYQREPAHSRVKDLGAMLIIQPGT